MRRGHALPGEPLGRAAGSPTVAGIIEARHVRRDFEKDDQLVAAVGDVTLSIREGEFVSIVGPSGCGKSTMLNLIAGLQQPSGGELLYRGTPVKSVNTDVGYMTQRDTLLPWRRVAGNIELALDIQRTPRAERRERVAEVLSLVGLTGFERHYPRELSGGMQKRALLARTLVYNPSTLLMDEPFGALDAQLKLVLHDELSKLWAKTSKTIVFVTHDIEEAITLSDVVVVMSARPGYVKEIFRIGLERPRDVRRVRFSEEFGNMFNQIWTCLEDDFRHGEAM